MVQRSNGKTAVDFSVFYQYLTRMEFETVVDCNLDMAIDVHGCDMVFWHSTVFFKLFPVSPHNLRNTKLLATC